MLTFDNNMQIVNENLDNSNYQAWNLIMNNFLKEEVYWDYIEGAKKDALECPTGNPTLQQVKALKEQH